MVVNFLLLYSGVLSYSFHRPYRHNTLHLWFQSAITWSLYFHPRPIEGFVEYLERYLQRLHCLYFHPGWIPVCGPLSPILLAMNTAKHCDCFYFYFPFSQMKFTFPLDTKKNVLFLVIISNTCLMHTFCCYSYVILWLVFIYSKMLCFRENPEWTCYSCSYRLVNKTISSKQPLLVAMLD